jgi:hypothetical protein
MEHRFESHGLSFVVEGDGFLRNNRRDDFVAICQRIKQELAGMPAERVARLHAAAFTLVNSPDAFALDDLAQAATAGVTSGWIKPEAAWVALVALPERPQA